MTSKLIIKPRRSNKTTMLFEKCVKDVNGVYVVFNNNTKHCVREQFCADCNIITAEEMINNSVHLSGATMYLDEYFLYPEHIKKAFFNAHILKPISFVAIGTPTLQFKRKDISDVNVWWTLMKARKAINILKPEEQMIKEYSEELMFNLIVAPEVEVEFPRENELKQMMSKKQYEMEILGQIFEGE